MYQQYSLREIVKVKMTQGRKRGGEELIPSEDVEGSSRAEHEFFKNKE